MTPVFDFAVSFGVTPTLTVYPHSPDSVSPHTGFYPALVGISRRCLSVPDSFCVPVAVARFISAGSAIPDRSIAPVSVPVRLDGNVNGRPTNGTVDPAVPECSVLNASAGIDRAMVHTNR